MSLGQDDEIVNIMTIIVGSAFVPCAVILNNQQDVTANSDASITLFGFANMVS